MIDKEFLELYGGLKSYHEEKRQAYFLQLRQQLQSTNGMENSPPLESEANIFPVVVEMSGANVS